MTDSKSFVMVNLELIQAYGLSFFEAGLLERIRYFSEFDQSGSGWCFVGKERLSIEFGVSKPGLLKAIGRLIERNLLIRNDKGWLMCNFEGVNKVDCKLSLPVNKVSERGKLSLPNKILKEDNNNLFNSDNYINSNVPILLSKQSLPPVNKVDRVNKVSDYQKWVDSGSDGKTEVRPYVWLDESELEKLTAKYGDSEKLNTAIEEVSASKASRNNKRPTKFNYELHYKNSYQVLNSGWAWENHLKRVELENRVKSSENFLQVSESRLNGNNPQNKTPETSFNPKTEQSTYDKKIMQPKPSFIVSESGRKIYLNWESLISLDGWPDCRFPAVTGETKLKHLPEIDKQAYCSFFQIEIESLKPRN